MKKYEYGDFLFLFLKGLNNEEVVKSLYLSVFRIWDYRVRLFYFRFFVRSYDYMIDRVVCFFLFLVFVVDGGGIDDMVYLVLFGI